jgi:uncharacterized membrane protein YbhN (UPF0104 family)
MHLFAGFLILAIVSFSVFSGLREISVYRKARRGEPLLLVSKKRLRRRLVISSILLIVSLFLVLGFFVLSSEVPLLNLLIWIPPLILILLVVYLSIQDFRETSRDLDRILRDASEIARQKIKETTQAPPN